MVLCRYLDAPGAGVACLRGPQRHAQLPLVTMVFCAVEHAEEMKVSLMPCVFMLPAGT